MAKIHIVFQEKEWSWGFRYIFKSDIGDCWSPWNLNKRSGYHAKKTKRLHKCCSENHRYNFRGRTSILLEENAILFPCEDWQLLSARSIHNSIKERKKENFIKITNWIWALLSALLLLFDDEFNLLGTA